MYDIIIATYNEKKNIKPLFYMINDVFKQLQTDYRIILVDDSSPDKTYEEASKYKNNLNLKLILRKGKLGLGSAYKEALKHSISEYVIIMDADLSHNPYDIKKLVSESSKGFDIVCGSRYQFNFDSGAANWSFMRRLVSRGANNLAQVFLDLPVSDCTGSFRIYKRDVLDALLEYVKSSGFSYQVEILYLAAKNGFKIGEVPIIFSERLHGKSKMNLVEIFKFFILVLYCTCRIF